MNGLVWLFQASPIHEINMLVVKDVFSALSISSYPPAKYRHEGEKKGMKIWTVILEICCERCLPQ